MGFGVQKRKQEVTKVVSLVENGENPANTNAQ